MTERTWRQKCGPAGVVVVSASFLAFVGRLMVNRDFIESHSAAMGTWSEIGFVLGIIGVILGLISPGKNFKTPVLLGSMIVLVLWFWDIAWAAVMK
ncbi:MAG: hypothetical protein WBX19_17105 [Terracidiphilus sp.]